MFIAYFDYLISKLDGKDFAIISGAKNRKNIAEHYNLDSRIVSSVEQEAALNKQYFLRGDLVLLKITNNAVSEFTAINPNSIKKLNFE